MMIDLCRMLNTISHAVLCMISIGCMSDYSPEESPSLGKGILIEPITQQPIKKNRLVLKLPERETYVIPKGVLPTTLVQRPYTFLRGGPGTKYDIEDQLLEKGDFVILLDEYQHWCRIYVPSKSLVGWSHRNSLGKFVKNQNPVIVKSNFFPIISSASSRVRIFPYPKGPETNIELPRGSVFRKLMSEGQKNLVLIQLKASQLNAKEDRRNSLSFNPRLSHQSQLAWIHAQDAW